MVNRTKEEMFEAIREWEMEAGESFTDYFESNVNEANFVFWCVGKGYMTVTQMKIWEKQQRSASFSDIVCGSEEYSVVYTTEHNQKDYDRAYDILAQFLCSSNTYQQRVDEFLQNIQPIKKLEDVYKYIYMRNTKVFLKYKDAAGEWQRYYVTDTHMSVVLPIKDILTGQWYIDNNED
jgi:hypothetical protein